MEFLFGFSTSPKKVEFLLINIYVPVSLDGVTNVSHILTYLFYRYRIIKKNERNELQNKTFIDFARLKK